MSDKRCRCGDRRFAFSRFQLHRDFKFAKNTTIKAITSLHAKPHLFCFATALARRNLAHCLSVFTRNLHQQHSFLSLPIITPFSHTLTFRNANMPGPPPYAEFYDVDDPEEVKVAEINAYLAERKASGQKVLNYEEMKKLDHALNAGFITSRSNGRLLHPPLYDPVPTSESDSLKSSRGTAPAGPKISAGESSKSADVDHPLAWIKTQLRPTTSMKRTAPAGKCERLPKSES